MLSPRWVFAHVVVLTLAIVFVNLGAWQLRRLDDRRLTNAVGESRFRASPVLPILILLLLLRDDLPIGHPSKALFKKNFYVKTENVRGPIS